MFERDDRWFLPLLIGLWLLLLILPRLPQTEAWTEHHSAPPGVPLPAIELATWILEGRNDFIPVLLQDGKTPVPDDIPGLRVVETTPFPDSIQDAARDFPDYKDLILLTLNGDLGEGTRVLLTGNPHQQVYRLEGGVARWLSQITAESPDFSELSREQQQALQQVRMFFHPEAQLLDTAAQDALQERYIAPLPLELPLFEEDPLEEEGC